MNKQEAIKLIEKLKEYYGISKGVYLEKRDVINIISKIDEPQKVTVPKFVAEWIEEMKQDERPLYSVMSSLMNKINNEWTVWKGANMNFSEIVAQAWIYGYEIEQEFEKATILAHNQLQPFQLQQELLGFRYLRSL